MNVVEELAVPSGPGRRDLPGSTEAELPGRPGPVPPGGLGAREELGDSEAHYRATFESLSDLYFQTDADGLITLVSPSALSHSGWTPNELVGRPLGKVFIDDATSRAFLAEVRAMGTVNDREALMLRRDGTTAWASINAQSLVDVDDRIIGFRGTLRNIDARKAAEAERDEIFQLSVDMLTIIAPGAQIARINPAWTSTLGYRPEDVVGTSVFALVHPEDLYGTAHMAVLTSRGQIVVDVRARFRAKDGTYRWLSWNLAARTAKGLIFCVSRDITGLVEAEEASRQLVEALQASTLALAEQALETDRLRAAAEYLANHDVLTGALNRRAWFDLANATSPTAVGMFDIDLFKSVNDHHGHPAGDAILRDIAHRLNGLLEPHGAVLGRLGGEEFGVLFHGTFAEARILVMQALATVRSTPVLLRDDTEVSVTVSAGLAPWRDPGRQDEDPMTLAYEEADAALYEAKQSGRDRVVVRSLKVA